MNQILDNVLLQGRVLMEELGLDYFLVGGTLLGIIRENSLLAHDHDIDVAVLSEDLTDEIMKKMKGFKHFGCESKCVSPHGQLNFKFQDISFDIFPMVKIGNRRCYNQSGKVGLWWPEEYFEKPFGKVKYLGLEWGTPTKVEDFLVHMYTEDWKVESKDFKWQGARNFVKDIIELEGYPR
jgi:hypothetical protein